MSEANGGSLRISADMTVDDVLKQSAKYFGESPIWELYDAYKKAYEQSRETIRSQDALIKELAGALRKTRWALESCSTKPAPGFGRVDEPITVMIQEYSQIMVEESLKDVNAALAKVKQ